MILAGLERLSRSGLLLNSQDRHGHVLRKPQNRHIEGYRASGFVR